MLKYSSSVLYVRIGLREFLLLEFATCLMSHRSLWQVGALYLDHCPTQGRQRLECLLERMPLQSEKKANKVGLYESGVKIILIIR